MNALPSFPFFSRSTRHPLRRGRNALRRLVSPAIFIVCAVALAGLRGWSAEHPVVLVGASLPLLVCLAWRDPWLLWALAISLSGTVAHAAFVRPPGPGLGNGDMMLLGFLQIAGVLITALLVQLVILRDVWLQQARRQLSERTDELTESVEKRRLQNNEMTRRADDFFVRVTVWNARERRHSRWLSLVRSLGDWLEQEQVDRELPPTLGASLLDLFGGPAVAAAMLERRPAGPVMLAATDAFAEHVAQSPEAANLLSTIERRRQPLLIEDLAEHPELILGHTSRATLRGLLAIPLKVAGVVTGALVIYWNRPHRCEAEDFELAESVGRQCGLALELRRLRTRLAHVSAAFDREMRSQTAERAELVAEMERFSYALTHNLRAPLRSINGYMAMLAQECREILPDHCRDFIQRMTAAAERMDRLIMGALQFSQSAETPLPLEPIDVGELLRGMIESYPAFHAPGLRIDLAGEFPRALANPSALTQCFSNLLDNAIKFVPPDRKPHVIVRGERREAGVRYWVEDNGAGIPAAMGDKVFALFQQASRKSGGTGVGLALVRRLVGRMQGRVGFESVVDRGSRFWLELRAAE